MKNKTHILAILVISALASSKTFAGQVSVINPSGVGGTIGTILPVIIPPAPVIEPPVVTEPTVTVNPPVTNVSTPTTTSTSVEPVSEVASIDFTISEAPSSDTIIAIGETPTLDGSNSIVSGSSSSGAVPNDTSISLTKNSSVSRTQNTTTIAMTPTALASFTPAQIMQAINFIETSLSNASLSSSARVALQSELNRLTALQ